MLNLRAQKQFVQTEIKQRPNKQMITKKQKQFVHFTESCGIIC